jgi:hypothetical protein
MNDNQFDPVEAKIVAYLKRVGAPNTITLIAPEIRETRQTTKDAVARLMSRRVLFSEPDFTFLANGETEAFGVRNSN